MVRVFFWRCFSILPITSRASAVSRLLVSIVLRAASAVSAQDRRGLRFIGLNVGEYTGDLALRIAMTSKPLRGGITNFPRGLGVRLGVIFLFRQWVLVPWYVWPQHARKLLGPALV